MSQQQKCETTQAFENKQWQTTIHDHKHKLTVETTQSHTSEMQTSKLANKQTNNKQCHTLAARREVAVVDAVVPSKIAR